MPGQTGKKRARWHNIQTNLLDKSKPRDPKAHRSALQEHLHAPLPSICG